MRYRFGALAHVYLGLGAFIWSFVAFEGFDYIQSVRGEALPFWLRIVVYLLGTLVVTWWCYRRVPCSPSEAAAATNGPSGRG